MFVSSSSPIIVTWSASLEKQHAVLDDSLACLPFCDRSVTHSRLTSPAWLLQVRDFISGVGIENVGKRLINSKEGKVEFEKPAMSLATLLKYGQMLVDEQENVKRVQLADAYLAGAELAGTSGSSLPEAVKL